MKSLNCKLFFPVLLIISLLTSSCAHSQSNQTFECNYFTFEYPSIFKPTAIKDSSSMVLRLASDSCYISASIKDKGVDGSIGVWDDFFVDHLYNYYAEKGEVVSIKKESVQIKDETCRCVKIMVNMQSQTIRGNTDVRLLLYVFLRNGIVFDVAFSSYGKYTKSSLTTYPEEIMKGFKFKDTEIIDCKIDEYMIEVIKKMNAQCPLHVDQCTTHLMIFLSGKTIIIKSLVEDVCDDKVNYDDFKRRMCENFSNLVDKQFIYYLYEKGYSLNYLIYNENDHLKKKILISPQDILNSYN